MQAFTPRLRDRLAKDLLASREAREDVAFQTQLMMHRYGPRVGNVGSRDSGLFIFIAKMFYPIPD